VEGLEHCAACHTDKNMLGGDHTGQELQGGFVVDGWNAPSLADDASGINTWSVKDIATYLRTGHNAYADATGPMADAITHSTSHLSDADLTDMAIYLKSVRGSGAPRPAPLSASLPVMQEGAQIYADECSSCHTDAGVGKPGIFPALKASPIVQADNPLTVIRVVLNGAQSVATIRKTALIGPASTRQA
jgi:mono/diheme cytochrome c family protein